MSDLIHVEDIKKAYGRKAVLNGVSLDVPEGAVIGLLGKNGAGKSTLIKCLLGLLKVDSGKMSVFGEDPWEIGRAHV